MSGDSCRVDRHRCGDWSVTGSAPSICFARTRWLGLVITTSRTRSHRVIAHGPHSTGLSVAVRVMASAADPGGAKPVAVSR